MNVEIGIEAQTVVELVEKCFAFQALATNADCVDLEACIKLSNALEQKIMQARSRSHADFVAKLRLASHLAEDNICDWLPAFLNTLGKDYERMIDFIEGGADGRAA